MERSSPLNDDTTCWSERMHAMLNFCCRQQVEPMPIPTEVFTPSSTPTYTYVDRTSLGFETRLINASKIPNMVVSVSGPSKSGKTVLIKKVVSDDLLITVSGSVVKSAEDLWNGVLAWIEVPSQATIVTGGSTNVSVGAKAGGAVGIPLVAKGVAEGSAGAGKAWQSSVSETYRQAGLDQVVKEIADSDFVVFIDDFHYIPREVQQEIGRQIKAAAEMGVKIFTASVPHRSDDVVRSNPELRGRVAAIDLDYWDIGDLKSIAKQGFSALKADVSDEIISRFATEAFGSPQLMQTLCLNLCFERGIEQDNEAVNTVEVSSQDLSGILRRATSFSDYSTLVSTLHAGPKQRGTERKVFKFSDGTSGDVYRAVLLAISGDPAKLSLRYDEMLTRVSSICLEDAPVGSSISEALTQMEKLSSIVSPTSAIVEWDENVLDVVEPYFLFYLRCSGKLGSMVG